MPATDKKRAALPQPRAPKYVVLPIDDVLDDPKNENVHTDEQIIMLRASIREFDQVEDILIDRQHVCIGGHGIKLAMKLEGKTRISCKYSDLEGARRAAYRIGANQLARLSFFDPVLLRKSARSIAREMGKDFDPLWIGLQAVEWEQILKGDGWHGKAIDPSAIGDYDPDQETFLIKIENVSAADKKKILKRVTGALEGTGYEARAY